MPQNKNKKSRQVWYNHQTEKYINMPSNWKPPADYSSRLRKYGKPTFMTVALAILKAKN